MSEKLVVKVLMELGSLALREWSKVSGIEETVERLCSRLEDIRVLLEDAEKRQIQQAAVKRWLDKLKAVSYEMDALLDGWNTANSLRNLSSKVEVISSYVPYFNGDNVQRPGLRHRTARNIETLLKKFDEIYNDQIRSTLTRNVSTEYEHRRDHTTSGADASEVLYGRDKEKETLSDLCKTESDLCIIPIVGMGGIGKTALVRFVFNKVGNQFHEKFWVPVSHPFDIKRIAKAILEDLAVRNGAHNLSELGSLLRCVGDSIRAKRFLLVLDDVWNEDLKKWRDLEKYLRHGAKGSKILVTTRKQEVATTMGAEKHMIALQCLTEDDCCHVFNQEAFQGHEEERENLEQIGKSIARKCRGLPLAAKVLGSLMQFREYETEDWNAVLHSELWELGTRVIDQIFVPFLLSYNDLSPGQKCCFLYCSYFPKGCRIDRDELIQLWMSQGYVSSTEGGLKNGVRYFENLAKRYFFQEFIKDDDGNIISCNMHDIVHDFVLFLTKDECFNALVKGKKAEMKQPPVKPFHCMLFGEAEAREVPSSIYKKRNLRTLSVGNLGSLRWDLLLKLKHLRTLNLSHCSFSGIPENIDILILLRYLNLSHNGQLKKLPKTLCNLFNLQTLKLEDCAIKLPKKMEKLRNLRHLYLGNSSAVLRPKELGKLSSLETLDHYVVPPPKSRSVFQVIFYGCF